MSRSVTVPFDAVKSKIRGPTYGVQHTYICMYVPIYGVHRRINARPLEMARHAENKKSKQDFMYNGGG